CVQAEDGIRGRNVTGVQTCALPIFPRTKRGKDALVGVNIDLETAAFGGTVDLDVTTAVVCDTCSGAGTQEGTSIETCSLCHGAEIGRASCRESVEVSPAAVQVRDAK